MNNFGPGFCCQTGDSTFNSKMLWHTAEFLVDTMKARSPGPVAAKSPNHNPSTSVLDSWYDVFFINLLWPTPFCFQRYFYPFRCKSGNITCAAIFFSERQFSPSILPGKPYLFSLEL
ncbi:hypothetical protein AMECASPLE_033644 [Ameca splendens]|uniref:Uncharacterized protein n=1 Tax=Ameca splendens TaxID=208324 RepID=A0ABV0ZGE2_9TELE